MPNTFPQITIDPALMAQPQPTEPTSVPLQPIPLVSAAPAHTQAQPLPSAAPASATNDTHDRRSKVQTELEQLQQEENSLLNNIKDWLTKVQGAETKQQALERELFELDRQIGGAPSPAQAAAERSTKLAALTQQLQQAQTKLKEITKLQKIDEKKAFDNYSAGGLDRQGLLDQMEIIRQRYADQLAGVQTLAQTAQTAIEQVDAPLGEGASSPMTHIAAVMPTEPVAVVEQIVTTPAPTPSPVGNPLVAKLATMPQAKAGVLYHLVVELPNQGTLPLIERSSDGTGVIVSADANAQMNERCYIADADLLQAGATAEDIVPLANSQVSSQEATALA